MLLEYLENNWKIFFVIVFLFVFTFPEIEPVTEIGLDPSYRFATAKFVAASTIRLSLLLTM